MSADYPTEGSLILSACIGSFVVSAWAKNVILAPTVFLFVQNIILWYAVHRPNNANQQFMDIVVAVDTLSCFVGTFFGWSLSVSLNLPVLLGLKPSHGSDNKGHYDMQAWLFLLLGFFAVVFISATQLVYDFLLPYRPYQFFVLLAIVIMYPIFYVIQYYSAFPDVLYEEREPISLERKSVGPYNTAKTMHGFYTYVGIAHLLTVLIFLIVDQALIVYAPTTNYYWWRFATLAITAVVFALVVWIRRFAMPGPFSYSEPYNTIANSRNIPRPRLAVSKKTP